MAAAVGERSTWVAAVRKTTSDSSAAVAAAIGEPSTGMTAVIESPSSTVVAGPSTVAAAVGRPVADDCGGPGGHEAAINRRSQQDSCLQDKRAPTVYFAILGTIACVL
jgi:hypothetical protein